MIDVSGAFEQKTQGGSGLNLHSPEWPVGVDTSLCKKQNKQKGQEKKMALLAI